MRSLVSFLVVAILCLSGEAQVPQGINYQAVARNIQGQIIPAQNVNVRFSILDASPSGNILYQETHSSTTNNFGLFTLVIGKGSAVTGTFSGINWASGTDKFIKVEIAPQGGNNYELQNTTQLLSVPYALYSEKTRLIPGNAINITNGNTIAANYNAGTGINISGSTISHALQAGTGISINGPTISGNYVGGNGVSVTGNTIAGTYTGGSGINVTGSTISHALQAGTGINITGNTISATGSSTGYWLPHTNGIYYPAPQNIGIRTTPAPNVALTVFGETNGIGSNVGMFTSNDTWHTAVAIKNNTSQFTFIVAGPNDTELTPRNFGILNGNTGRWPFTINSQTNNIGIGSPTPYPVSPRSTLHVLAGDVNIEQVGSGIIMKSPNGNCWRITVDNTGNLVRTAITCP
jgi:hypothetical protein